MKRKLGVNIDCLGGGFDEAVTLELASKAGFEVFTTSKRELGVMSAIKEKGVALGMEFPFLRPIILHTLIVLHRILLIPF